LYPRWRGKGQGKAARSERLGGGKFFCQRVPGTYFWLRVFGEYPSRLPRPCYQEPAISDWEPYAQFPKLVVLRQISRITGTLAVFKHRIAQLMTSRQEMTPREFLDSWNPSKAEKGRVRKNAIPVASMIRV
jgi:hypothetical protein